MSTRNLLIGLTVLAAACKPSEHARPEPPPALAPAFRMLDSTLTLAQRDTLREWLPDGALRLHFSLGMALRNEAGLWRGGPVADSLRARGVRHPDDMSHVILLAYGHYLRGEPIDLAAIIQEVPPPPTEYKVLTLPLPARDTAARNAGTASHAP